MTEQLLTGQHAVTTPEQSTVQEQVLILWDVIYLPTMHFVAVNLTHEEAKVYNGNRDYMVTPS